MSAVTPTRFRGGDETVAVLRAHNADIADPPRVRDTVVLVALAIFALASGDRGVSRAAPGERGLSGSCAKLGEVASVTVLHDGSTLTLIRDGDSWLVAEKGNYPANAAKISQIVRAMADLTLVEPKTRRPDLYPRLEVEDPGAGNRPWSRSRINRVPDRPGDRRETAL